jgi:CheY-like chemotaxis protein
VLIVDDNRDAANTLAMLLAALGQEVHCAHDGEEALRAATRLRPDVVLLDLGMPPPDGFEIAQRLRAMPELGAKVKIVAVTGWGQQADRERSRASGFDLHLVKPLGMDDVRRALAGS